MKRSLPVLVLGLCAVSAALATTYVRVEKDGTKTYSDRPIPGGEPIDLKPAQSYSAPAATPSSSLPREQRLLQEVEDFKYESCSVTPENDATFTNPESVPIAVVTAPALRPVDLVTMTVDGQPIGEKGLSSFTMTPVHRGTHTVSVTITNRYGKTMCTVTSSFHVMRPSLNTPSRPNAPRPTPH
jgi:Domain of unknown function (DUF4124)